MILALYGAGAMGREEKYIADQDKSFSEVIFIDDIRAEELLGCKVYSFRDFKKRFSPDEVRFIIAMGEPRFRRECFDKMKQAGYIGAVLKHPSAYVSPDAVIGEGAAVCQGVYIGSLVRIGANAFIGGHVKICDNAFLGSGASLKDRICVGKESVVALGSAVFNDVPDNATAVGNPARIVSEERKGYVYTPSTAQAAKPDQEDNIAEKYWDVFSGCFADIDFNPVSFRFNDSGWDSIMQMALISRLEEAFGISLKGRDILKVNSYQSGLQMVKKKLSAKEG